MNEDVELKISSLSINKKNLLVFFYPIDKPLAPQIKLSDSKRPTKLSLAHQWAWTQNIFWDPRVPNMEYNIEPSPLG
jgi:hypothetical protein